MMTTRLTEFELPAQHPGIGGYLLMGIEDLRAMVKETEAYGSGSMVKIEMDNNDMTTLKFTVVDDGVRPEPKPRPSRAKKAPVQRPAPQSPGGDV